MSRKAAVDISQTQSLKSCFKFLSLFLAFLLLTYSVSAQCTKKKTRDLVSQGNESFKTKDFSSAVEFYQKAIKTEPNCSLAYFNLGQTQRFLNQTDAAIGSLERALNLNYPDKAANYLALGVSYSAKGQRDNSKDAFTKAASYAKSAVEIDANLLDAWRIAAFANRQLENAVEELNALTQIVRLSPNNAAARREKGLLHNRLNEYDKAFAEFEQLIKIEPNNPYNFLTLSDLYRLNGRHSAAMGIAVSASMLKPDSPDVSYTLGNLFFALKDYNKAVEAFRSAINLKTEYLAESYYSIASAQIAQGKYTEAVENLKQSLMYPVKLYPENVFKDKIFKSIGACKGQMAEFHDAIYYLLQVSNEGLADSNLYVNLSWWYSLLGEDAKALQWATTAIEKHYNNAAAYTNRCRVNYTLKKIAEAEQDCKDALELDPNDGKTLFYYSRILRDKNRKKEADAANKKAIALLEKEIDVKNVIAEASASNATSKKTSIAFYASLNDNIEYLLSINVASLYSPYILGNAYFDDNQPGKAINAYKLSLQRAPRFPLAHLNLGIIYSNQNDKKSAQAHYAELVKIDRRRADDLKKIIDQK